MSLIPVSSFHPITLPMAPKAIKKELITQVAILSLKEVASFFVLVGITSIFMISSITPLILTSAILFSINLFARSRAAFFAYEYYQSPSEERKQELTKQINQLEEYCASDFSFLDLQTREPLCQEIGHFGAARILYKNANPQMYIFPFKGRFTLFSSDTLSFVGKKLGQTAAQVAVIGSGSLLALSLSLVYFVLSYKYRDKYPRLSIYGNQIALFGLFTQVKDALEAMTRFVKPGNDFTFLWTHGKMHPIISVITLLAAPILIKAFLTWDNSEKGKKPEPLLPYQDFFLAY
jgi:hypothetical protein